MREREILQNPSHLRNQLVDIHNQMDQARRYSTELTEAFKAGDIAMKSIINVINHLQNAKKWGNWDQMSKGGGYYDRRKYGAIDRAVNEAYRSKQLLHVFANELDDVGINLGQIDMNIESFGGFLDQLFDNLITDWIVQNKIANALRNSQNTHDRVLRILQTLEADIKKHTDLLAVLQDNKDQLLTA